MPEFIFTKTALKKFRKTEPNQQKIILKKLNWLAEQKDPLTYAKRLTNYKIGEYRFRIGDYRIIFDLDYKKNLIIIINVGHRREIYK